MLNNYQNNINVALKELSTTKSISSALFVCNTLLEYMGVETKSIEDIELSKLRLPNAERYDRWFEAHPHFRGDRACFQLTPNETSLEAKFYAIQKRSRLFIAGSVNFTPNFEDRDYTRTDPNTKVGIDFFLTPEKNSVIVALSDKGNLRLVELFDRLTNTQNEIFTIWHNIALATDRNALHTTIWESFKLSSLNKKFYEGIANSFTSLTQHLREDGVEEQFANQFASRLHGRLLFLWFLRKKNVINESKDYFTLGDQGDDEYYENTLSTLFFNVLNNEDHKDFDSVTPYLNGGLFDQKSDGEYWNTHKPTFPTGFFKTLYDHFSSFNFTTDESTPEYEQIAIDPEMLGRIFESFLATLKTETGAQAKKANGAFYTPREIVSYMCRESLRQYLYTALDASITLKSSIDELLDRSDSEWAISGTNSKRDTVAKEDRARIMEALRAVRVLDPAVGSGAFPMGILHKILSLFERLEPKFDPYETKLSILRNNIYGVDIDPTAIEIARLRAWLSIIVDVSDIKKIKPLPNLDFKFVCANTLIGLEKSEASFTTDKNLKPELIRIRDEYYATSSKAKKEKLQREYIKLTHKESLFDTGETRQLKSYRPFENGESASFYDPELMHGVDSFDVVIGNPPYIQLQKNNLISDQLSRLSYQTFLKSGDIYCVFYELGIRLVKEKGVLIYITSNSWLKTKYGSPLRDFFLKYTDPIQLIDFTDSQVFDSAIVESNILLLKKDHYSKNLRALSYNFSLKETGIGRSFSENSVLIKELDPRGWIIGDIASAELRSKIESESSLLKNYNQNIYIGILNGYNEAFIIDEETKENLVKKDPRSVEIIKPMLRGRDVGKYEYDWKHLWMINSHNGIRKKIPRIDVVKDYSAIYEHLLKYKDKLETRQNKGSHWTNLRNCAYFFEFEKPKIIWGELSDKPKFAYDDAGYLPEASLFGMVGEDLKYLLGILNSKLAFWYFGQISTSSGMGTNRWKKYKIEQFPIRLASELEMKLLEEKVEEIISLKKNNLHVDTSNIERQIDILVYKLYRLNEKEIKIIEGQR